MRTSLCRSNPHNGLDSQGTEQSLQPTGSAMAHAKAYLQPPATQIERAQRLLCLIAPSS